jgi:hypothetical protein
MMSCVEGGSQPAEDYTFFHAIRNANALGQASSYIRESYQQLRQYNLLLIGCHM